MATGNGQVLYKPLGLLAELVSVYLRQDDDEFAVVARAGDDGLAPAAALGPHGLGRRA